MSNLSDWPEAYENGIPLSEWDANKLPIGVMSKDNTSVVKNVAYAQMTKTLEDLITNDNIRANRPQTWMARLVTLLLSELGTESPASRYKPENPVIPDIVKRMSLQDSSYVLMQGHIYNFGNIIKGVQTKCPTCEARNMIDLDLLQMRIIDHDRDGFEPIGVFLENGYRYAVKAKLDTPDIGKVFNFLEFRTPTISDSLACERFYRRNAIMSFNQRINSRCVIKIAALSNPDDTAGVEMSTESKSLMGMDCLDKFNNGADRQRIRRETSRRPRLWSSQEVECVNCSDLFGVEAPYETLFPLV